MTDPTPPLRRYSFKLYPNAAQRVVRRWAESAEANGSPIAKVVQARQIADHMDAWNTKKGPD